MISMEEPKDRAKEEDLPETEVSETRYMGEGPPNEKLRKNQTEVSETIYMDEPPERKLPKHAFEYKKYGPRSGRATLESKQAREKWHPRWKKSA